MLSSRSPDARDSTHRQQKSAATTGSHMHAALPTDMLLLRSDHGYCQPDSPRGCRVGGFRPSRIAV